MWLDSHFGRDGHIERVYTPARARDVGGTAVLTPWEGRFTRYETRHGFLIPIEAVVAWLLPEAPQTYWRAHVTHHDRTLGGDSAGIESSHRAGK